MIEGPRPSQRQEVPRLRALHENVFGITHRKDAPLPRAPFTRSTRKQMILIIADNGRPVSHIAMFYDTVSLLGCRVKTASISGVCIDPYYRGRGYTEQFLDQYLTEAVAQGARILIVSGDRGLYQRIGCRSVGQRYATVISATHPAPASSPLHLRRADEKNQTLLCLLYAQEPVRFYRCADTWEELQVAWDRGWAEIWIIERARIPVAYMCIGLL